MKKQLKPKFIKATINDYPTIQNIARFYSYDMSRTCGFIEDWDLMDPHNYLSYPSQQAVAVATIALFNAFSKSALLNLFSFHISTCHPIAKLDKTFLHFSVFD